MDNVGILLKGKSLDKLPLIHDKFNHCYIVNNWDKELKIFNDLIKDKNITQCNNSMPSELLTKKNYEQYRINRVVFSFTESMLKETKKYHKLLSLYEKRGIKNLEFLDEKYRTVTKKIRNTGVCLVFYAAEVLKAKNLWIAGLDFYKVDYLLRKNSPHQAVKTKKIKLIDTFIDMVKDYPNTTFNLGTYYKELPNLKNLKLI